MWDDLFAALFSWYLIRQGKGNTVEFRVEILDYGRYGCVVKEPRTGLSGEGDTEEQAMDDLRRKLWSHIEYDFVPPEEGPVRSIKTINV